MKADRAPGTQETGHRPEDAAYPALPGSPHLPGGPQAPRPSSSFCLPGPCFLCFSSLTSVLASHPRLKRLLPRPPAPAGTSVTRPHGAESPAPGGGKFLIFI